MRVSIWQQFSSNHSTHFTVVGRFASPEAATKAADELLKLMNAIAQWGKDYHQARKQVEAKESDPRKRKALLLKAFPDSAHQLPKPEREFSEKYNIEWGSQSILDWIVGPDPVTELVKVVGTDVFVTTNRETWRKPDCVLASVTRLGARSGHIQKTDESLIGISLSCQTPDVPTAESIITAINEHLSYLTEVNELQLSQDEWYNFVEPLVDWLPQNTGAVDNFLFEMVDGHGIQQDGGQVKAKLRFYDIGFGLPAFVSWLEHLGCTDIAYDLTEGPEWDHRERRRKKWPKS